MKIFKAIVFKKNGDLRPWLKNALFTQSHQPVLLWRFLSCDSDGEVRSIFRPWHARMLSNPSHQMDPDWMQQKRTAFKLKREGNLNWVIVTPLHTIFVAKMLQWQWRLCQVNVHITCEMPEDFSADGYVVICPQVFKQLPPRSKLICFQMEQSISLKWFTPDYINRLYNSVRVLDYSLDNIDFLKAYPGLAQDVHFLPIYPIPKNQLLADVDAPQEKKIDVLFYGHTDSARRRLFIKELKNNFNLQVVNGLYGEPLWRVLTSAKVIVNIHNYEHALFETTRISECLSLGVHVVSEASSDQAQHAAFEGALDLTPIGDVQAMVSKVREVLHRDPSLGPRPAFDFNAHAHSLGDFWGVLGFNQGTE